MEETHEPSLPLLLQKKEEEKHESSFFNQMLQIVRNK